MELRPGEKHTCDVIEISGIKMRLTASVQLNDKHQTELVLSNVSEQDLRNIRNTQKNYAQATINGTYLSMFELIHSESCMMTDDGTKIGNMTIIATYTILGYKPLLPDYTFSHFRFQITDGFELIGMCPYDVNEYNYELMHGGNVEIPSKIKTLNADTSEGEITFHAIPTTRFSKDGLSLEFDHWIDFCFKTQIALEKIRSSLQCIRDFFSLLSGEAVTINTLEAFEIIDESDYRSFKVYGICNFPKQKLKHFESNGLDTASYMRQSIFKMTDFIDISSSLNKWFEMYVKLTMANAAYDRIMLDEEMEIVTANKFLASMQLVEGYISIDEEKKIEKFEAKKRKLLSKITNPIDNTFVEEFCSFMGQTFRKKLKEYSYNSMNALKPISKTQFNKKYGDLLSKIIEERDIYTHSSSRKGPQIEFNKLMRISSVYKTFYRILVLTELELPSEVIRKRLAFSRRYKSYLYDIFELEIENDLSHEMNNFDRMMWHFS